MPRSSSLRLQKPGSDSDPYDYGNALSQTDAIPSIVIEDPHSVVSGKTISEWTEDWWRWAIKGTSEASNPLLDPNGGAANNFNDGSIYFIGGALGGEFSRAIDVPAGKPILIPMIHAVDTEGPGFETLQHFKGSYAEEATFVTNLMSASIYDAYATLSRSDASPPLIDIHWPGSQQFAESTDIFELGPPKGTLFEFLTPLHKPVENLPFTRSVGNWLMIDGLNPGNYQLDFGGHGHKVTDPTSLHPPGATIFEEGWGIDIHDTLHVT
jgi:hypothetical protein